MKLNDYLQPIIRVIEYKELENKFTRSKPNDMMEDASLRWLSNSTDSENSDSVEGVHRNPNQI